MHSLRKTPNKPRKAPFKGFYTEMSLCFFKYTRRVYFSLFYSNFCTKKGKFFMCFQIKIDAFGQKYMLLTQPLL